METIALSSYSAHCGFCLFGTLLLRFLPTLPLDWKPSVVRRSPPSFPYLRLGLIAAAIILAALFSALGRLGTGIVQRPQAVANATPSTAAPHNLPALAS